MRHGLPTLALLLALPAVANASQIGVGLDWRQNVFVQEFWQEGKALYAIYNGRSEPITLKMSDVQFVNVPGTESFRAIEGKELASWDLKGKEVLFVDAPMKPAGDELRFLKLRVAEGPQLGLLTFPSAPASLPKGKIITSDGINGSGGRQPNVSYEQDSLTFKSGGAIELRLSLPAGGQTATFKKKKSFDNPIEAIIEEAECATLPIQTGKEEIVIEASKPFKAVETHTVTLRFKAPKVDSPTMAVIDGWVSTQPTVPGGSGYHVVRGVIIKPDKK